MTAISRSDARLSAWRPVKLAWFLVGVPHYPEHVDRSYWQRDAERMAAAGFNTVRLGEFAWHLFEPRQGVFEFGLFDDAIDVLGKAGIQSILCTPTATPPRWLTMLHPEVLRVDEHGRPASHGSRQHADTTSPVFREHSRRITRALADHYRGNGHVAGWQTDNELNTSASRSYSLSTRIEFQHYLEESYGSIEALNHAWGGDFWATRYDNFDQIVLPFDQAPAPLSPGHEQDYHRFLAWAVARFQAEQVEILRAANPDWFIFHNLGRLDDIDFRGRFSTDLDFLGFDIYPMLYDEMQRRGGLAETQALHLDICRGFAGNFIVPEQQSGFGAQPRFSTMTPEPGEMRRMAYSSVARGADGLMFFRWRPAHFGAEIYWMGIIDHDDVPRRRYDEARQFATEMTALQSDLLGTHVRMDVGIAGSDFDNQEAHRTYPIGLPSPLDDAVLLHQYCYRANIACGFVHPEDELSRLKIFYVPHWVIWKDEWSARLEAFAQAGGTVIVGARTGTRDGNNHIIREAAPGRSLGHLAGIEVEEFGRLAPLDGDGLFQMNRGGAGSSTSAVPPAESSRRHYSVRIGNQDYRAAHLYEIVRPTVSVDIVGTWSNRFLAGAPAITMRTVGRGRVLYVGTYLTDDIAASLARLVFPVAGVEPLISNCPPGIEVTERKKDGVSLTFLINTTDEASLVRIVPQFDRLVGDGTPASGGIALPPYGCAILKSGRPD